MTSFTVRTPSLRPLRFGMSLLVLAGVATTVFACSSGELGTNADPNGASASASDGEVVAKAEQGLGWKGGCSCLPVSTCPSTDCVTPTTGRECSTLIKCRSDNTVCYVEPDGTSCLTGSPLGLRSTCDGGVCGTCSGCYTSDGICNPGTTVASCGPKGRECRSCNDSNPCTTDSCSSGACSNVAVEDKTSCSGGACFGGKCCTGCHINGECQGGTDVEACGTGGGECKTCAKPSNPCLRAVCTAGGCGTEPVAEGTSCSDGKFCNGNEACDNQGNCIAGTPPDCTSSDPCVTKQCDEAQQTCAITANVGVKCSDGNACTVGDACDANGKCTSNGNKNCNDGKTCTADTCDPATGDCVYKPVTDGFQCDDGVACTTGETCRNGQCIAAGTVSCDDNNICTQDILDCQTSQCSHAPVVGTVACVPTDKCFYNGECSQGSCVGKTPVNCDDGNPCTKDSCDPASGCVHANEPVTTVCSDGNPCTADDRCRVTGKCVGTPITCAAIDDCHLPGICDEATGRCGTDPRRDDGAFCANGNGRCLNGSCRMLPTGAAGATGVAGAPNAGGNEGQAGSAGALTDVAGAAGTLGNAGNAGTAGAADIGGSSAVALGGATASTALGGGSGNPTSLAALGGNPSSRSVDDKDVYHRNPGGCSCSVPNHSSRNGLAALMVLGLAWVVRRRRPIG